MICGLGSQLRPCLRVATFVVVFVVFAVLYVVENSGPRSFERPALVVDEEGDVFRNTNLHADFLVWSSKCMIPDVDPYQKSVMKLMKPAEEIVCSDKPVLTRVERAAGTSQYRLVVDSRAKTKYVSDKQSLSCCFSVVTRVSFAPKAAYNKTADNMYSLGNCTHFENETILDADVEFILVKCRSEQVVGKKKKKKVTYSNMHAVVPIKEQVKWKMAVNKSTSQPRRLSVLLIGLDSISRLNMIRKMPKTRSHLNRTGWVEFKGYNKVGDNTFPNLVAILTGYSAKEIKQQYWQSPSGKFDDCPFIWKNFSERGYVTLYAEDEPTMSTFNYHKTGFVNPPTDYYIRPYILTAEQQLPRKTKDSMSICLGPVSTADHVLNYTHDFLRVFKDTRYFGLVWLNNFSHNNPNTPSAMDSRMAGFLEGLSRVGATDSSMIVFLSDHGMRFGKIRETSSGWLEERLPFFYIWLPEWFRKENPAAYRNLVQNGNRLTSPFDLHLTLRSILHGDAGDPTARKPANMSSECVSCADWFSGAAKERSCEDAGITPHWCTCYQYKPVPTDGEVVQKAAKSVVCEMQFRLQSSSELAGEPANPCATLELHSMLSAKVKLPHDGERVKYNDYLITFVTVPGEAIFESTVRHWDSGSMELQGVISRLNSYSSQSKCISDSELKPFCFCAK